METKPPVGGTPIMLIAPIEKAIMNSDLGLNPSTAGEVIRIPMPPLTEERRKDLVKVVRHETENGRVAIRNIRRDANKHADQAEKSNELTEDDRDKLKEEIQDLTKTYEAKASELAKAKESEVLDD